MSCCRRSVALLAVLLVCACGFRPLYLKQGEDQGVAADLTRVRVLNVIATDRLDDRLGQKLQNLLRERLNPDGRTARPLYRLAMTLKVTKERTGVQITEEATRARLRVNATFRLTDAAGKELLTSGSAKSVNSYNIVESEFATLSAENDAADRAIREISEEIRLRLGLYMQRQQDAG